MSLPHDELWVELEKLITNDSRGAKVLDGLWKFAEEDFHGVSDAANDLRVYDARCESAPRDERAAATYVCGNVRANYVCALERNHCGPHLNLEGTATW